MTSLLSVCCGKFIGQSLLNPFHTVNEGARFHPCIALLTKSLYSGLNSKEVQKSSYWTLPSLPFLISQFSDGNVMLFVIVVMLYISSCVLFEVIFFPTGLHVVMHEFGSIIIGGSRYWHVYELWVEIVPVMNHKKVVFFWVQNQYQANNVVYSLNCILGAV